VRAVTAVVLDIDHSPTDSGYTGPNDVEGCG
jgi:hypothetical protein